MRISKGFGTDVGAGGGQDLVSCTVVTRGVSAHRKATKRLKYAMRRAGAKGLRRALNYLLKETKKVTPKRTGALRRSGEVTIDSNDPPSGSIVFGEPYAVYVHEDLDAKHKAGTYAKYLERTVKNRRHMAVARKMIRDDIAIAQAKVL